MLQGALQRRQAGLWAPPFSGAGCKGGPHCCRAPEVGGGSISPPALFSDDSTPPPSPPFPTRFKQVPRAHLQVITPPLSRALGRSPCPPPHPPISSQAPVSGWDPRALHGAGGANAIGSHFVPAQHQLQLQHPAPSGDPQPYNSSDPANHQTGVTQKSVPPNPPKPYCVQPSYSCIPWDMGGQLQHQRVTPDLLSSAPAQTLSSFTPLLTAVPVHAGRIQLSK